MGEKLVKFGESSVKLKLSELAFTLNNLFADLTIHLSNFSPQTFLLASYSVVNEKEISKLIDSCS